MPTLSITQSYADDTVLTAADLDSIVEDVETFLNTTKIDQDNIQTGGVSTANLAANAVTTVKITDANVTTAKIADSNVTTAKINDSAVTTAKINDSAVTTAKINDGAVTSIKQGSLLFGASTGQNGGSQTIATTFTDVTGLTDAAVTKVNANRRIAVFCQTDNGNPSTSAYYEFDSNGSLGGASATITIRIQRKIDAGSWTTVFQTEFSYQETAAGLSASAPILTFPPGCFNFVDVGANSTGTYTYKMQAQRSSSPWDIKFVNCMLVAVEL